MPNPGGALLVLGVLCATDLECANNALCIQQLKQPRRIPQDGWLGSAYSSSARASMAAKQATSDTTTGDRNAWLLQTWRSHALENRQSRNRHVQGRQERDEAEKKCRCCVCRNEEGSAWHICSVRLAPRHCSGYLVMHGSQRYARLHNIRSSASLARREPSPASNLVLLTARPDRRCAVLS